MSFDQQLAHAHSQIAWLQEQHEWVNEIAAGQAERIVALERQLAAARASVEALRASGVGNRRRLSKVLTGLLFGAAAVAELSGYSARDLVSEEDVGLAPLICHLSESDMEALGIEIEPSLDESASSGLDIGDDEELPGEVEREPLVHVVAAGAKQTVRWTSGDDRLTIENLGGRSVNVRVVDESTPSGVRVPELSSVQEGPITLRNNDRGDLWVLIE